MESFPYKAELYKKLDILSLLPEDEEKPDLRKFIGPDSLLLFYHLGMANSDLLSWLTTEPKDWDKDPCYKTFRRFVKGMAVVNDAAER
mgnify:CR=1 FL=1